LKVSVERAVNQQQGGTIDRDAALALCFDDRGDG
jgi:hypothetical protein